MLNTVESCAPSSSVPMRAGLDEEAAFLDYLLDDIWDILAQGVRVPIAAAHTPTLATLRRGLPKVRTVVLRDVSRHSAMIFIHADRNSSKVQELLAQPACSLHVFDAGRRVQLRIDAHASLHLDDEIAEAQWARLQSRARLLQRTDDRCAGRASADDRGFDDIDGFSDPAYRPRFAVIALHVSAIEWLQLRAGGARHARFEIGPVSRACWLEA